MLEVPDFQHKRLDMEHERFTFITYQCSQFFSKQSQNNKIHLSETTWVCDVINLSGPLDESKQQQTGSVSLVIWF